jgi:hypothetical protein
MTGPGVREPRPAVITAPPDAARHGGRVRLRDLVKL